MNSGLEWNEDYGAISDVTSMLFEAEDMTRSQLEKPLAFQPNTHWNYSSGTTNLLSGILRKQFKTHQEYLDFWYSALIDKIGMHSMLVETDMAGQLCGFVLRMGYYPRLGKVWLIVFAPRKLGRRTAF